MNVNFDELKRILDTGTREELDEFILENDLEIVDGKIKAKVDLSENIKYWDKLQHIKKISLNSFL